MKEGVLNLWGKHATVSSLFSYLQNLRQKTHLCPICSVAEDAISVWDFLVIGSF